LHVAGITDIQTSGQAAEALRPVAGRFAFSIFTLGILGTGLLAVPVLAGSAAYAIGEARKWPTGLARLPLQAKAFYATLAMATLVGIALNFTSFNPIQALFWSAVINGVVAVPVMVLMMLLTANTKVMGQFRVTGVLRFTGWLATAVMAAAVVGMLVTAVLYPDGTLFIPCQSRLATGENQRVVAALRLLSLWRGSGARSHVVDNRKLSNYRAKRNFAKTAEPRGAAEISPSGRRRFVIQKHDATRLHYDLRLELDGTFKSWAVTRGPSLDPHDKRLAVEVEDHPLDYGDFEGTIPKDEYGGGTVQLWDRGYWEPEGKKTPEKALASGDLKFSLEGKRLHGSWVLVACVN
jgi:DNA ligase D-like protein (predicted 3'-phosphoesterase)